MEHFDVKSSKWISTCCYYSISSYVCSVSRTISWTWWLTCWTELWPTDSTPLTESFFKDILTVKLMQTIQITAIVAMTIQWIQNISEEKRKASVEFREGMKMNLWYLRSEQRWERLEVCFEALQQYKVPFKLREDTVITAADLPVNVKQTMQMITSTLHYTVARLCTFQGKTRHVNLFFLA